MEGRREGGRGREGERGRERKSVESKRESIRFGGTEEGREGGIVVYSSPLQLFSIHYIYTSLLCAVKGGREGRKVCRE